MKTGQMLGKHYECYDRRRLQYTGTPSRGEGGWGNNYALCNVMLRTETRAFYLQIQFVYKLTTIIFFYLTENCAIPWTMFPSFSETGHARPHLLRRQRNLGATISVAANVRRRSSVSVSSDISSPSSPPWRRKGMRVWFNLKVLSFIMRDYHDCRKSEELQ